MVLERQLSTLIISGIPQSNGNGTIGSANDSSLIKEVSMGPNPPLGDPSAPVVIIEFSDFNCPYCKQSAQILKELITNNPGKIQLYYRHAIPIAKTDSFRAALAAECAGKQGYFWEMHDALFDSAPDFSESRLLNIAKTLRLKESDFVACLSAEEFKDRIQEDFREAQKLGVQGTPTFFINGRMIVGSQTLEQWQALLNLP